MSLRHGLVLAVLLAPAGAAAQSVITLEDFDPAAEATQPAAGGQSAASDMASCLREPESCENAEFRPAATFSIDDVYNLGIIDREKQPPRQEGSGAQVAATSEPLPSIDMEVLFDYDSAELRGDQMGKLVELAGVLRDQSFASYGFIFLGHSDAKGTDAYNRELSRRRAQAVATFVRSAAGLADDRTTATGLGFSRLKDPAEPYGAQNRRVQLVLIPR